MKGYSKSRIFKSTGWGTRTAPSYYSMGQSRFSHPVNSSELIMMLDPAQQKVELSSLNVSCEGPREGVFVFFAVVLQM